MQTQYKTDTVLLEGFQAILKASEYGYSMSIAVEDAAMIEKLEEERADELKYQESKLKNPRRKTVNPEPWEEVANGKYILKFRWDEKKKPPIVDTEGTPVTDENIPLYSGSKVRVAFVQGGYTLPSGTTIGTKLYVQGVQVVSLKSGAGVDVGDLDEKEVAELFGTTKGFKLSQTNVITDVKNDDALEEEVAEEVAF